MMRTLPLLAAFLLAASTLAAQPAPAPAAEPGKHTCNVDRTPPSPAVEALAHNRYQQAEGLFAAMPASSAATAGKIRAMLGERKVTEALALAQQESDAHPTDALLLDALGAVRYRRGDIGEATKLYLRAEALDACQAMLDYDLYRYERVYGIYASAQKQLNNAHILAPTDPRITRIWEQTQQVPPTAEQRLESLHRQQEKPDLTDEQKQGIEASIKAIETRERGDCQLVSNSPTGKIAMQSLGNATSAQTSTGAGIDITFNGKRRRFLLDTGASGLVITREAAKALGLVQELQTFTGGIGDNGPQGTFVSHVDDIKVGNMEFHNCLVRVLEGRDALHGVDGLIGADTFRSFVVTLDMPGLEVRLTPLPKRPDEATETVSLGTGGDDDETGGSAETKPQTYAQAARDRYIAPEMKDWTRVFRSNHLLIFNTLVGSGTKQQSKLFAMDTGASTSLISPQAAREVTSVAAEDNVRIQGVSGDVKNVQGTGDLYLQFAGIRQLAYRMLSVDTSGFTRNSGFELSGFIGYATLRELVISIDYRDNLVHIAYQPHLNSEGR